MSTQGNGTGLLFNISGPYAVGKDTVLNMVAERHPEHLHRVRTITTRAASKEVDPSYESVTRDEFMSLVKHGNWMTNSQLDGSVYYATSIDEITEYLQSGINCIHSVFPGPQGAGALRQHFGTSLVSIALVPPGETLEEQLEVLRERLISRNRDDADTIAKRLTHQVETFRYIKANEGILIESKVLNVFDYVLVNAALETTVRTVSEIFEERIREWH